MNRLARARRGRQLLKCMDNDVDDPSQSGQGERSSLLRRRLPPESMIRKSGYRFSGKII
jgi:hypothetical protein